jgi:hypothetical protein
MSALALTLSAFGGLRTDPHPVDAQGLQRHAADAAASPWASAKASPGAERLEQMSLNPQPLPPREVGIGALERIDDFCGTRVPLRVPPPPPPTPLGAGLSLQPNVLSSASNERGGASRIDQKAAEVEKQQQRTTEQAEQARDARAGWANALNNLFGADTPKMHPAAEAAQELASTKLQTMLAQLQAAEHKAGSMADRLGDLQAQINKRL